MIPKDLGNSFNVQHIKMSKHSKPPIGSEVARILGDQSTSEPTLQAFLDGPTKTVREKK